MNTCELAEKKSEQEKLNRVYIVRNDYVNHFNGIIEQLQEGLRSVVFTGYNAAEVIHLSSLWMVPEWNVFLQSVNSNVIVLEFTARGKHCCVREVIAIPRGATVKQDVAPEDAPMRRIRVILPQE